MWERVSHTTPPAHTTSTYASPLHALLHNTHYSTTCFYSYIPETILLHNTVCYTIRGRRLRVVNTIPNRDIVSSRSHARANLSLGEAEQLSVSSKIGRAKHGCFGKIRATCVQTSCGRAVLNKMRISLRGCCPPMRHACTLLS